MKYKLFKSVILQKILVYVWLVGGKTFNSENYKKKMVVEFYFSVNGLSKEGLVSCLRCEFLIKLILTLV